MSKDIQNKRKMSNSAKDAAKKVGLPKILSISIYVQLASMWDQPRILWLYRKVLIK